ncbi:MAG TPA: hypothetical protein VGC13_27900 [Longimicrobium sp.]|jgi:hypothetical protein|uniref:hypothetical protein n=1 Tax=Longimicrobium sp. TaxID=2029185 RepID=UPI002ED94222
MSNSSILRKALFAAGVLGCMGFGGAQAFASPDPVSTGAFCNDTVCTAGCLAKGFVGGYCYSNQGCICYHR